MYTDTDPPSGGNKLEQQHIITTEETTKKTNNIYNKPIATTYLSVDYPVAGEETERNAVPDEGVLHL